MPDSQTVGIQCPMCGETTDLEADEYGIMQGNCLDCGEYIEMVLPVEKRKADEAAS